MLRYQWHTVWGRLFMSNNRVVRY